MQKRTMLATLAFFVQGVLAQANLSSPNSEPVDAPDTRLEVKDKVLYYYFDREECRKTPRAVFRSKPDFGDRQFFASTETESFTFVRRVDQYFFEVKISDGSLGYIRDIFFKSEDIGSKKSLQSACILSLPPEEVQRRLDQYIGLEQEENLRRAAALEARRQEEEDAKRNRLQNERDAATRSAKYVDELRTKYGRSLKYGSPAIEKYIGKFNIDCKIVARYVPLRNILLARIAQFNASGENSMTTFVLSNGRNLRIFDQIQLKGRAKFEPTLAFEINDWGELRGVGISSEAILNTCFGSFGPIWKS